MNYLIVGLVITFFIFSLVLWLLAGYYITTMPIDLITKISLMMLMTVILFYMYFVMHLAIKTLL